MKVIKGFSRFYEGRMEEVDDKCILDWGFYNFGRPMHTHAHTHKRIAMVTLTTQTALSPPLFVPTSKDSILILSCASL